MKKLSEKKHVSDFPDLMLEWDWTKNNELGINPYELTHGSKVKAWWVCIQGHKWQSTINHRTNGRKCPYCSGHKILSGFNDLATNNPILTEEWNYEKNGDLLPAMVSSSSHKKIWWICNKNHEWQETVAARSNSNYGCPYCSGHRILVGFNDLATTHPQLTSEWNTDKNKKLTPFNVSFGSNIKVWWKCRKGHEWQASITSRTSAHCGCPVCQKELNTSFCEQAVYYYCSKVTKADNRNIDFGKEIDIYLPIYNIGIEYNGKFYHKDKKDADNKKVEFFAQKNIRIITITEGKQNIVSGDIIEYIYNSNKSSLNWVIHELFKLLNFNFSDINCERDYSEILSQYLTLEKKNSLAFKYPGIAKEWNYEKNISLTPEMVSYASQKLIWWKCALGHEWQENVSSRTLNGFGCPYCSGHQVLLGFNDLVTKKPKLAEEWNYSKNGNLLPNMVTIGSNKSVWWKCTLGHEWQALISKRALAGNNCPYCTGKKVLSGYNDLVTINPPLAQEWNYEKNNELLPTIVTANSRKKVWWKCALGHEWQAVIASRNNGTGCPYCANKKVLSGYNDLSTVNPELSIEWNYEKNGNLLPNMVTASSELNVWWIGKNCKHEWQSTIENRNQGRGCPYCSGHKVLSGFNDLATNNPKLAEEWNYERNNELLPTKIAANSMKKIWWKCSKGHEWQAVVANRNRGTGCPYCTGKKVLSGYNDLATINPSLAGEWDYDKNDLCPTEVRPNSHTIVWWICRKCNHNWEARIDYRNKNKSCPYCKNTAKNNITKTP